MLDNLHIFHWNCNSIKQKLDSLKHFISTFMPSIMSINETKLNEISSNRLFIVPGYQTVHKARGLFNGAGGVALLIRNKLEFSIIKDFDDLNLELLAIKIKFEGFNVAILSYFDPPDKPLSVELFSRLCAKFKFYILLGDLNAKSRLLGDNCNQNGRILADIIMNEDAISLNNKDKTHRSFSGFTESVLDLALCSSSQSFLVLPLILVLRSKIISKTCTHLA